MLNRVEDLREVTTITLSDAIHRHNYMGDFGTRPNVSITWHDGDELVRGDYWNT